jgi:hypothetical protein
MVTSDYLRRGVHADALHGAPLLALPAIDTETAGEVQDTFPLQRPHQVEEDATCGVLQGGGLRLRILLAPHVISLYWLRGHRYLLVLRHLTWSTLRCAARAPGLCGAGGPMLTVGVRGTTPVTGVAATASSAVAWGVCQTEREKS